MTFGDLRGRGREGDSIGQFIRRTATVFTAIEPRTTQCAAPQPTLVRPLPIMLANGYWISAKHTPKGIQITGMRNQNP
jgi:hypothetical protein